LLRSVLSLLVLVVMSSCSLIDRQPASPAAPSPGPAASSGEAGMGEPEGSEVRDPESTPPPAADDVPTTARIARLGLELDIAGSVEIFDTDTMGDPLEANSIISDQVRLETSAPDLGTMNVEVRRAKTSAKEALSTHKIVTPDMSHVVTEKLGDGWVMTYQYNKDAWYAVDVARTIGGRWILCDARPDSAAAAEVALAACKSLRVSAR